MTIDMFIEKAGEQRAVNFILMKDGRIKYSHNWDHEQRRNVYSAAKSFTSAAVGIAEKEGLLSIDELIVDIFKEELPQDVSENLKSARIEDLLTMCLGQENPWLMSGERPFIKEKNWVKYVLSKPFTEKPGQSFLYNNAGPYLAGVIVQRRAGCSLCDYLYPRLFEPLDIMKPMWESDPLGYTFGAGGLFLCVSEMAKFGQLYIQDGLWNGKQIIPENWIRRSTQKHADVGDYGYGYLFWLGENSFRADGMYGQLIICYRQKGIVITLASESRNAGELIRLSDELACTME